jgi:hypothetical protein
LPTYLVLLELARQKETVGLLPFTPNLAIPPRLVPVIAAPDDQEERELHWRGALKKCRQLPPGLRVWRVADDGVIAAELHV